MRVHPKAGEQESSRTYSGTWQKHADKFEENAPIVSMMDVTSRMIDFVITMQESDINEFMLKSKYFSQFVEAEEGDSV